MRRRSPGRAWGVLLVALVATACGAGDARRTGEPDAAAAGTVSGDLLVSAAASLTDAFSELEEAFEARHPSVDVVLNLAGSSTLREQVLEGAPADVFASADADIADDLVDAGATAGQPTVFARNALQVAVPAGNPAQVAGLEDFDDKGLFLGLCAQAVPCGKFARQALDRAGVTPSIDTNEPDVRALLTKIAARELDAGVTYVTDVVAAGPAVDGIDIPTDANVVAHYPIAVLADAPNPEAAAAFVDHVLSESGQDVLRDWGFATP